jgi:hypothetical protein
MLLLYPLFALRAYGFLITVLYKKKKNSNSFLSLIPLLVHSVPPVLYLLHPSYLPPLFIQFFSPSLSLLLFHFATSIGHMLN